MMDTNTSSQVAHAVVLVLASTTTSNNHSVELIRIHYLKFAISQVEWLKRRGKNRRNFATQILKFYITSMRAVIKS